MKLKKKQEPIVKAIKEQTELTLKQKQPVKEKTISSRLDRISSVRDKFRPRVYSTPSRPSSSTVKPRFEQLFADAVNQPLPESDNENIFEVETLQSPDDEALQNRSIRMFTESENIGDIAKKYLNSGNDRVYGIYYNFQKQKLAIGSQSITIENDDIILDDTMDRYKGTEGLWVLVTKSEIQGAGSVATVGVTPRERLISINAFTMEDFENYKDILIKTHAIYQNYDSSGRPKSNAGWKWKNLIGEIWKEMKEEPTISGSGLMVYNNCPIEFRPIGNFQDLIDRMHFIRAEENAGNNNFHNDITAIRDFVTAREQELCVLKKMLHDGDISGSGLTTLQSDCWLPRKKVNMFLSHYLS